MITIIVFFILGGIISIYIQTHKKPLPVISTYDRLRIYKEVLETFKVPKPTYLCGKFHNVLHRQGFYNISQKDGNFFSAFPEIIEELKKMDTHVMWLNAICTKHALLLDHKNLKSKKYIPPTFWFACNDVESRIELIENCITNVEKQLHINSVY